MAKKRPKNDDAFRYINGVGDMKLERYGTKFMQVISEHPLSALFNNSFSDTINETLVLYNEGLTIDGIASKRDLSATAIYSHLADVIEAGMLNSVEVLDIEDEDLATIERAAEFLNSKSENALRPLFEALDGEWNYGILRCVVSGL